MKFSTSLQMRVPNLLYQVLVDEVSLAAFGQEL